MRGAILRGMLDAGSGTSRLVYIAAPYAAPTEADMQINIDRAVELGRLVKDVGYLPVVPHLMTTGLVDEMTERQVALDLTMETLRAVFAAGGQMVVLAPGAGRIYSRGVIAEVAWATSPAHARTSVMRGRAPSRVHVVGPGGMSACHPEHVEVDGRTGEVTCAHCRSAPMWFRSI